MKPNHLEQDIVLFERKCLTKRAKCIQDVRAAGGGTGDKPKHILHLLADPSRYFYQQSRVFFASYADLIKIVLFVARKWRVQDNLADECVGALCAKYLCPQRPKRVQKVWTSCYQRKYLRWTDFIMKWVLLEFSVFFASF